MPQSANDFLRDTLRDNPRKSEFEIREIVRTGVMSKAPMLAEIFEYWFNNMFRRYERRDDGRGSTAVIPLKPRRAKAPSASASKRAAAAAKKARERVAAKKAELKTTSEVKESFERSLMNHVLPDGSLLKYATVAQCRNWGGWLSDITKGMKPNEVIGKHLDEKSLRAVYNRHFRNIRMRNAA